MYSSLLTRQGVSLSAAQFFYDSIKENNIKISKTLNYANCPGLKYGLKQMMN